MFLNDSFHDGQPNAGAVYLFRRGGALKQIKHRFMILFINAQTVVFHLKNVKPWLVLPMLF